MIENDKARALRIITGERVSLNEALALVGRLKAQGAFGLARRLLAKHAAREPGSFSRQASQEWALCTYKDRELPVRERLERALDILRRADNPDLSKDQETLGLAGAIHKYLWDATGRKQHLERSLHYYMRGSDLDRIAKDGYTSINAAFILDLLAHIEETTEPGRATQRREQAMSIRRELAMRLATAPRTPAPNGPAGEWWYLVTVAEAFFGIGRYDDADIWLGEAKALAESLPGKAGSGDLIGEWQFQTTAFQLARINTLQHGPIKVEGQRLTAIEVLDRFVGPAMRSSALIGKVGLALSGGGFRASLFHLGVLASMAERDLLRHVEVLSCVSGGSIVGAHYYLQLREMLETEDVDSYSDEQLRKRYVELVRKVAQDFLAGVQTNIRMQVFAKPGCLLRPILDPDYSRTIRLGELLETELFSRVFRDAPENRKPSGPLLISKLSIIPLGRKGFDPGVDNVRRKAKVPALVLNATTLNTAHNWQYTTASMGESPHAINQAVDGNNRFRRVSYDMAVGVVGNITLGQAVVASACVPGLFEPVRMAKLYDSDDKRFVIRQVDGGVYDNQGIESLREQNCDVVLVSDASGQITTVTDPGGGVVGPLQRSNDVLMQRVRQAQFDALQAQRDGGLIRGLMFIHLKQDLDVVPINWHGCEEPAEVADHTRDESHTPYGIRKQVQELLAGIRTDLDSFSNTEAFALMTSGYRMASYYLCKEKGLPVSESQPEDWHFLKISDVMNGGLITSPEYGRLTELLAAGRCRLFRTWRLSRDVRMRWGAGPALILLLLLAAAYFFLLPEAITVSKLFLPFLALLAALFAAPKIRAACSRPGIALLGIALWGPARLHLRYIDREFLRLGQLQPVPPPAATPAAPISREGS